MLSFGDSKHEPVKPLQSLLKVQSSDLAIYAKCTIRVIVWSTYSHSIETCNIFFSDLSIVLSNIALTSKSNSSAYFLFAVL